MRKLLFSSIIGLLAFSCGTSEDSVTNQNTATADSVLVDGDGTKDSSRAITHGSPNQAELDSLKKAKLDKKKK